MALSLPSSYAASAQSKSEGNKHVYSVLSSWGTPGTAEGQLLEPADLSIDGNSSTIYIADKDNNRIQKFDLDGHLLENWGTFGAANGQFNASGDVFVDSANKYVFVADIGNNRIQKFYLNGTFLSTWGLLAEATVNLTNQVILRQIQIKDYYLSQILETTEFRNLI